ncbi:MAG: hypothetical protein ACKOKF_13080, partial [Bacteroidota bacterium]
MKTYRTTLLRLSALFLLTLCSYEASSQTMSLYIDNDTTTSATVYEFDIKAKTDAGSINGRTFQFSLGVNSTWLNGGTPTITILSNGISGTPGAGSWDAQGIIKITSNTGVSCALPTVVNTTPKTIYRVRVTNSTSFGCASPDVFFSFGDFGTFRWKTLVTSFSSSCTSVSLTATSLYNGGAFVSTATGVSGPSSLANNNRPTITAQPANASICQGFGNTFSVGAVAGSFPSGNSLSYQWSLNGTPISGATGSSYQISSATTAMSGGVYSVVVSSGCATAYPVTSGNATLTVNVPVTASITGNSSFCAGSSTSLSANSSSAYAWSPGGATSQATTVASAGTYQVTTTDANGCTSTASLNVTQNPLPVPSATMVPVSCNGGSNGSIDLSVSSGTSPFSYSWSNGATTEDISGLGQGSYSVTVTDANGCTATASVAVTQPTAVALSTTQTNVLCNGAATGSVDLTVTGGTAPYSYSWSNGATTQDIGSLSAGTYNVTVNDANGTTNGCTASTSVTITQSTALSVSTTQVNPVCNGAATGSIDLTVGGGTAPYSYTWSNGATTQDISSLTAGTYNVTVNDANGSSNGCSASTSVIITQPSAVSVSTTQTNPVCNGVATGSIDLTVSGGTAPYTYTWSNGSSTEDISSLAAGTYNVTVNDANGNSNGCTASTSVTITQPSSVTLTSTQTNVLCNGASTGAIDLSVSGGTAPYTYTWSN